MQVLSTSRLQNSMPTMGAMCVPQVSRLDHFVLVCGLRFEEHGQLPTANVGVLDSLAEALNRASLASPQSSSGELRGGYP